MSYIKNIHDIVHEISNLTFRKNYDIFSCIPYQDYNYLGQYRVYLKDGCILSSEALDYLITWLTPLIEDIRKEFIQRPITASVCLGIKNRFRLYLMSFSNNLEKELYKFYFEELHA